MMILVTWHKCGRISASGCMALPSSGLGIQTKYSEASLQVRERQSISSTYIIADDYLNYYSVLNLLILRDEGLELKNEDF